MFSVEEPVLSSVAIAERLGVARSTAYRYLQSLVGGRFLEEAPAGGFRLGLRVLEIARVARRGYGLSEVALPLMRALSAQVGETVLLTRRVEELVVCVDRAEADVQPARISYDRGSTLPINAGASALVLLAWVEVDEARQVLQRATLRRFTDSTLTDVEALLDRLEEIRRDGYAITRAELDSDTVGIAAPIFGEGERVVAAISVAALASRMTTGRTLQILPLVQSVAREIGDRLGVVDG